MPTLHVLPPVTERFHWQEGEKRGRSAQATLGVEKCSKSINKNKRTPIQFIDNIQLYPMLMHLKGISFVLVLVPDEEEIVCYKN